MICFKKRVSKGTSGGNQVGEGVKGDVREPALISHGQCALHSYMKIEKSLKYSRQVQTSLEKNNPGARDRLSRPGGS